MKLRSKFILLLFTFVIAAAFSSNAAAQRRDYMTEAEIELVRDAQDIDTRIDVLTKMIDRRFVVLGMDSGGAKPPSKGSDKWGDPPTGTRAQLLSDISKILQKAVEDIDDVARREEGKQSRFFIMAMHKLSAAATKFQPQFKTLLDAVKDEKERGALLNAGELCNQIIEASSKVPREIPKEEKKKKN